MEMKRDFLSTDLQYIRGVGPVLSERLSGLLGGHTVLNFLFHRPINIKNRRMVDSISSATTGDIITVSVRIGAHKSAGFFRGRGAPARVLAFDKMGTPISIQFFNAKYADYWFRQMPIGSYRAISGKLEASNNMWVMNHPDFIEESENIDKIPTFQAIYPLCDGITQKTMAGIRDQILPNLPEFPEWLDKMVVNQLNDMTFCDALRVVHKPSSESDLDPESIARKRLAYDELLAHQIAIAITRVQKKSVPGRKMIKTGRLVDKVLADLPFQLTMAQDAVIHDILRDMANSEQMMRLVMGDVGSGKTIVALIALLVAVESGTQGAFMAPTDVLAGQHFQKIKPMCDKLGIVCDILTGRDTGKTRREKLTSISSGRTKILIGTHALFQGEVVFRDLGLIVIDEQHRFGVNQRLQLSAKGNMVDVLSLSATPIPRTLAMTMYGDMDISVIDQKPIGRIPIKTTKLMADKIPTLIERMKNELANGAHVFWVCPLVNESETSDLMAAEDRYAVLRQIFGDVVGLAHGQMDKKQRDAVMAQFADPNGPIKILVATTVIEVGVDVPQATIMVIEDAWRFGLSALHQLRGRVGRGSAQSFCILTYGMNTTPDGLKRLDILCETDNGFEIAESDLMMRGNGEMLGTKQSGWIPYHFVDYRAHRDLFRYAAHDAMELVKSDPKLESARGLAIRQLLKLFDRIDAMNYINA